MRLRLDSGVRRFGDGRVLLGGSPSHVLRLGAGGARLLDSWLDGTPVDTASRAFARRLLDAGVVHPIPADTVTKLTVTLVVPVRDNPDGLARVLAATTGITERTVVDDASATPLAAATVRHHRQRGPAAARNTGWRSATTPLVAFLDSDTVPSDDWLETVLPLFHDPAVAAVAPRVRSLTGGPVGRYEARRSALDMGSEPAAVRPDGRVRYVPAAALVVRVDALRAIGGFDETLRFGEDVDLVWRLLDAGYSVRYQPDSTVHHEPRRTVAAFVRQRFDYGTSAAPLARRHPRLLPAAHLTGTTAAQVALVLTGHSVAAGLPSMFSLARTAWTLHRRDIPLTVATTQAASGQLALVRHLADALRRVWWPLALCTGRGRRLLLLALLAATVETSSRTINPALAIADDIAYGLGVWTGCVRHRTLVPLAPRLHRRQARRS
ncbi:mycofactocin system glycosyltransferase [Nocardia transvalensis]|uniref:Mycofactocin system glycosyltransferase n=1 Tax=Nocardia transvalensis TaxID=37333 RepID=A0A7W9UM86_9NOCA|nr:mycofactocin biosynthesis glycosyltransferase MftF [Nocardia transvalensis]MBB5918346.1 mycofactocin system glycosyltransferase [Nocardia transvalensis]